MLRSDFYFIPQAGPQARLYFACRLLEKAYQQTQQVYVHLENAEKARFFDQLLWTFRENSFIPHHLLEEQSAANSPIQIGYSPQPQTQAEILLNLQDEIPDFYTQFKRILEIVPHEPTYLARGQKNRVFYEEKGYKINSYQCK